MQRARAVGANGDVRSVDRLADPALEIRNANVEIDHAADSLLVEHERHVVEEAVHDRLGRRRGGIGIFACLEQIIVVADIEPLAQLREIVEDILEGNFVQILHQARAREGNPIGDFVRIGR